MVYLLFVCPLNFFYIGHSFWMDGHVYSLWQAKNFLLYQKFWPCDVYLEVWPSFEKPNCNLHRHTFWMVCDMANMFHLHSFWQYLSSGSKLGGISGSQTQLVYIISILKNLTKSVQYAKTHANGSGSLPFWAPTRVHNFTCLYYIYSQIKKIAAQWVKNIMEVLGLCILVHANIQLSASLGPHQCKS